MQADAKGTTRLEGKALGDLYLQYAPDALRLAYLLTGDRGLAEDLVQDAFVKLAGRFVHLRSQPMFLAYLRTTVLNLARSHGRRKAVERRYTERIAPVSAVEGPDLSDRERLRDALMGLPLRQRTAVVLRYYEDLPEAEVADLMHLGQGAVRSLVARGMATLRIQVGAI